VTFAIKHITLHATLLIFKAKHFARLQLCTTKHAFPHSVSQITTDHTWSVLLIAFELSYARICVCPYGCNGSFAGCVWWAETSKICR